MTTNDFGGVVKLTLDQYTALKTNGKITVAGQTINYNPATIYITNDDNEIEANSVSYEEVTGSSTVNAEQTATYDSKGNVIADIYVTKEEIPISLPLGTIIPAAIPLNDAGVHLLDGSTITQTGIYSDFTAYLRSLQNTYSNLFCTETEWQNINTINGECGKFVINDSNNTIRLPKITHIIQGTVNLTTIGDSIAPGLPNITGKVATFSENHTNITASGAFYMGDYNSYGSSTAGDSDNPWIHFDASRSNELYGASDTVQPRTLLYPYYIVVANNINKADVDFNKIATDINAINSTLNIKLDYTDTKQTAVLLYEGSAVTGTEVNFGYDTSTCSATFMYIQLQASDGYHFAATIPASILSKKYNTSTTKIVISTDAIYASIYFPSSSSFYITDKSSATNIISIYAIYNSNIGPSFNNNNNGTYIPSPIPGGSGNNGTTTI